MSYNWTPLHIKLLLHYYVSLAPFERPSVAASEYTMELLDMGLIKKSAYTNDTSGYNTTAAGKKLVEQMLMLPKPRTPHFLIIKDLPTGERLYWDNEKGWVDNYESSQIFPRRPNSLPDGGKLFEIGASHVDAA